MNCVFKNFFLFLIVPLISLGAFPGNAKVDIKNVRVGPHDDKTRVVLDLSKGEKPLIEHFKDKNEIHATFSEGSRVNKIQSIPTEHIDSIRKKWVDGHETVVVETKENMGIEKTGLISSPPRFYMDVKKTPPSNQKKMAKTDGILEGSKTPSDPTVREEEKGEEGAGTESKPGKSLTEGAPLNLPKESAQAGSPIDNSIMDMDAPPSKASAPQMKKDQLIENIVVKVGHRGNTHIELFIEKPMDFEVFENKKRESLSIHLPKIEWHGVPHEIDKGSLVKTFFVDQSNEKATYLTFHVMDGTKFLKKDILPNSNKEGYIFTVYLSQDSAS